MKKFILFTVLGLTSYSLTNAQEYNLFDPADIDANGWMWFDSQEKIDKYVGEGKMIQLFAATFGDEEASEADPTLVGFGTDAIAGGANHKIGGLHLSKSSTNVSVKGGSFEMKLPSCVTFSVFMSSDGAFRPTLSGGVYDEENEWTKWSQIKTYSLLGSLSPAGQKEWTGVESITNTNHSVTIKSENEIYAKIQNGSGSSLYIHGFKIITSTKPSGINENTVDNNYSFDGQELTLDQNANIEVYSLTGVKLANVNAASYSFSAYNNGVYILKVNGEGSKIVVR